MKFSKIKDPLNLKEFVNKYKKELKKRKINKEIIDNAISTLLDQERCKYNNYIRIVYDIYFDILCILYFNDNGNLDLWKIIDFFKKISYLENDIDFETYNINSICNDAYKKLYNDNKNYINLNNKSIEFYPENLFNKDLHIKNFRKACIPGTYDDKIIDFIDKKIWRYL